MSSRSSGRTSGRTAPVATPASSSSWIAPMICDQARLSACSFVAA